MLALIKSLVQAWLKFNSHDEVQVWTFDHMSIDEIPPGYSVVVRIERWSPINPPKRYETTTNVPGYDADLSD